MKAKIDMLAQALLGLVFFVFGLNGFFQFLPMPEMGEAAGAYFGGLAATGYFLPVLKIVETVCGLLLLLRLFSPLALVLLAPVVVQILLFHAFLDPAGLPMAIEKGVEQQDLHYFTWLPRVLLKMLTSPGEVAEFVDRYWYRDRQE